MFYTGTEGGIREASIVAARNNVRTIKQTFGGQVLNLFNIKNEKIWDWASGAYARNARGPIHLYVGKLGEKVHSTWIRVEKKILDSRNMIPERVY